MRNDATISAPATKNINHFCLQTIPYRVVTVISRSQASTVYQRLLIRRTIAAIAHLISGGKSVPIALDHTSEIEKKNDAARIFQDITLQVKHSRASSSRARILFSFLQIRRSDDADMVRMNTSCGDRRLIKRLASGATR